MEYCRWSEDVDDAHLEPEDQSVDQNEIWSDLVD